MRLALLVPVLSGLLLAPAASAQLAGLDPPLPYRCKDFALIKRDGLYHLFYIRHNMGLPDDSTETDLGHATSEDLYAWTEHDPVLAVRPGEWDGSHVWAPSIVERDGVYYLFYTGVRDEPGLPGAAQRIGIATSTDLDHWNRLDAPVRSPVDAPWAVADSTTSAAPFRDPFVMPDPATPGGWLMYLSAAPASDPTSMVVDVARSGGDLTSWSDLGPLWITHRSWSWNDIVESPHLFEHDGLWYLFFTTNSGQPISFATGPDPDGAPETWSYQGRLATMLGVNTYDWYASEHLGDGAYDYFAYVQSDRITIQRIVWAPDGDWRFVLVPPDPFHVVKLAWSADQVVEGDPVSLGILSVNPNGGLVRLEAAEVAPDGSEQAITPADLGLPSLVPVFDDTTRINFIAPQWPDSDATPGAELVVRLADGTAASPVLHVLPPSISDGGGDGQDTGGTLQPLQLGPVLRVLPHPPTGAGPALLVELSAPAEGRLELFDLQGRRVRELARRSFGVGATVVPWDGRTSGGSRAAPGVYFARLVTPVGIATARVLLAP